MVSPQPTFYVSSFEATKLKIINLIDIKLDVNTCKYDMDDYINLTGVDLRLG